MKIIFLGLQGSGKSTQAKILSEKLGIPYIEMGQVLRDRSKIEDETGLTIKKALESGVLVKNQITIDALNTRLEDPDFANGYIIDGYPRNETQLNNLPDDIDKVFYVKVSEDEALKRLLDRARHDDTPQLIKKRMDLYKSETTPLVDSFKSRNLLVEIDGERPIEEITEDIENRLKN